MTVSELIAALSQFDGSLRVLMDVRGFAIEPILPEIGYIEDLAKSDYLEPDDVPSILWNLTDSPIMAEGIKVVLLNPDDERLDKAMAHAPEHFRASYL